MNKEKINSLELSILSSYIYRSFFLINGINLILYISKLDSVISIIFASLIGLVNIYIFLNIFNYLPKYNIFKKVDHIFKKYVSIIIKLVLIITTIIFTCYLFNKTTKFINYSLLKNINIIYISILLLITIYYLINKNLITLIRSSTIIIFIYLLFEITSILFLTQYINPKNLLPILSNDTKNILLGSIEYFILSTLPIYLLLLIPKKYLTNTNKLKKYMNLSYIITNIYNIFYIILVLSIIDIKLIELLKYPQIFILSKISILNIFDRLENILSFKYLFDAFIVISLGIFYIKEGISSIFKLNQKLLNLIIPILILIINLSIKINSFILLISLVIFFISNIIILLKKAYFST